MLADRHNLHRNRGRLAVPGRHPRSLEPQDRRLELRADPACQLGPGGPARRPKRAGTAQGLLHHSDRGSQYVDEDYIKALIAAGIERSMSRAGNCYDNAAMESFWSTLKSDTGLDESIPASRRHAELAVFDYIETFYNPTRRHSSLGQISPVAFENQQKLNDIKAA
jgi:putative transposase